MAGRVGRNERCIVKLVDLIAPGAGDTLKQTSAQLEMAVKAQLLLTALIALGTWILVFRRRP